MTNNALRAFKTRRLVDTFKLRRGDCVDCPPEVAAVPEDIHIHGLAAPWGTTGDGRAIAKDSLTWNLDEPITIIWDRDEGDHTGAVLGKVDRFWSDDDGVHVEGRLLATDDEQASAAVMRVAELIEAHAMGWSVMLDDEETEVVHKEPVVTESQDGTITARFRRDDDMATIMSARIRHLALVDTAAFGKAFPQIGTEALPEAASAVTVRLGQAPENASAVTVATYPAAHFEKFVNSDPKGVTPLQVTEDGRVFGQLAGSKFWRNGSGKVYTPDPDPEMRNFHVSTIGLDDGSRIRVGVLTAGGLHSPLDVDIQGQRAYRENSQTVWAVIRAWDDEYGRLCASGSVIPGLDPTFLAQAAACPISIERWPIPGVAGVTLCGAHAVPVPALPVI